MKTFKRLALVIGFVSLLAGCGGGGGGGAPAGSTNCVIGTSTIGNCTLQ